MRQSVFLQERQPCTSGHAILIQSAEVVWLPGQLRPVGFLHYLSQLISHSSILYIKKIKNYSTRKLHQISTLTIFSSSFEDCVVLLINETAVLLTIHHQ